MLHLVLSYFQQVLTETHSIPHKNNYKSLAKIITLLMVVDAYLLHLTTKVPLIRVLRSTRAPWESPHDAPISHEESRSGKTNFGHGNTQREKMVSCGYHSISLWKTMMSFSRNSVKPVNISLAFHCKLSSSLCLGYKEEKVVSHVLYASRKCNGKIFHM